MDIFALMHPPHGESRMETTRFRCQNRKKLWHPGEARNARDVRNHL